jgi:hypothetical protein
MCSPPSAPNSSGFGVKSLGIEAISFKMERILAIARCVYIHALSLMKNSRNEKRPIKHKIG